MLYVSQNISESVASILQLHLVFIHCLIKVQHSKNVTFVDRHYLCPKLGGRGWDIYCVEPDLSQ